MPTYLITGPDGTKYKVSGPGTEQEALARVQAQHAQQPATEPAQPQQPQGPEYGEDMLRAVPSGLRSGVEGLAGMFGSAAQAQGDIAGWAAGKLGASPETQAMFNKGARMFHPGAFLPSADEIAGAGDAAVNAVPGSEGFQAATRYQPKTLPGKIVRTAAEIAPSMVAGPGGMVRKGVQTIGSAVGGELAGAATEGTAAEPYARTAGMVLGGGITAGGPKAVKVPPLSKAKINTNKDAAYALSEKAGVMVKPEGMKHLAERVKDDLAEFGYDEGLHPGAKAVLKRIEENQGQNVTLKGVDTIRKLAGNAYIMGNKSNNAAVSKIVGHIDKLLDNADPAHIAGIDTKTGVGALKIARAYAHRAAKMDTAENLIKKGNLNADRNITDTRVKSVKTELAKINDPFRGWGRGFTDAEKKAAGKAAKYTGTQRLLHGAGVLNPIGGGKLSMGGHLAAAAAGGFNPVQLAGQAAGAGVGFVLQKAAEHLAAKSVNEFVDLVARGGVPEEVVKQSLLKLTPAKREAVIRTLMATSSQTRQPLEITVRGSDAR